MVTQKYESAWAAFLLTIKLLLQEIIKFTYLPFWRFFLQTHVIAPVEGSKSYTFAIMATRWLDQISEHAPVGSGMALILYVEVRISQTLISSFK